MAAKDRVGAYGERVAVNHLERQGFTVLDRNWRCELGEIDIVAREGDCLVVVEVKTRRSSRFGPPAEAVTPVKLARLRRLTARWVLTMGVRPARMRIDVVSVLPQPRGAAQVEHLRAVG
ncbi:MAG TPA: YraN family protein [Actinomycetales bacterium]|nr:YraN family protein [Actinomycetales bacterium]